VTALETLIIEKEPREGTFNIDKRMHQHHLLAVLVILLIFKDLLAFQVSRLTSSHEFSHQRWSNRRTSFSALNLKKAPLSPSSSSPPTSSPSIASTPSSSSSTLCAKVENKNRVEEEDEKTLRQYTSKTFGWVAAAAGFGGIIAATKGPEAAIEFASGYALEQTLSVDNLFVFLLLFDYFKVSGKSQEKILGYGLWGAVLLRGLFIGVGTVALQQFHQVLLLFAGVLYLSSFSILFGKDEDEDESVDDNQVIKFAKTFLKSTDKRDGDKFFIVENGINLATPLFLCLICIEISDVIFAFDSVPAVFGVTQDPFIVFTSNIFAIAGLRSLYGFLSKAVDGLKYLEKAVGLILLLIAVKLTGETFDVELLSPLQSLVCVVGILGGGVALSLLDKEKEEK